MKKLKIIGRDYLSAALLMTAFAVEAARMKAVLEMGIRF